MTAPVRCPCGRLLRDPVSVTRGIGPVCERRLSGRTAPRAALPAPVLTPTPHAPGQTALDVPTGDLL